MGLAKTSKTKQRILNISLQLFNEKGERSVTTNHIAAALSMSPGNLYYHYNNKQDIIKALIEQYQQQTLSLLQLPQNRNVTPNDKIHYFKILSEQLWNYRFLHRDVYHLVENHQSFQQQSSFFSQKVMQQVQCLYQAFVDAKLMKMNPSEIQALIINSWIVLTNWTNFLFMSGHITEQSQLNEKWKLLALRQLIFLESPYLLGESKTACQALLESMEEVDLFSPVQSK